jgi:tetratricopeptide (TPR) repeat protein
MRILALRVFLSIASFGALVVSAPAQICDGRNPLTPIQIQLMFGEDAADTGLDSRKASQQADTAGAYKQSFENTSDIRVQLYEQLGGLLTEAQPNPDGKVRMNVCRNSRYTLRVTGSTIQEVTLDSIQPNRGDKLLTIVVHRRLTKQEEKVRKAMVAASRLRIPRKAEKEFKKGSEAFAREHWDKAETRFRKAIEFYSDYDEAHNALGILMMRQGRKAEGKEEFVRAVSINPRYAAAWINLAKIAIDDRDFAKALDHARQALTSEPMDPAALFVGAESAYFTHNYAETVRYSRTLHDLPHAPFALAHFLAGKSLQAQQLTAEAIGEYQKFLEEDPADPNAGQARYLLDVLIPRNAGAAPRPLLEAQ